MTFRPLTALVVASTAAAAVACSSGSNSPEAKSTPPALPGTTWQLVSLQSMDDAQGTTSVDPTKFTVTFDKNGTDAFFQLDCNRGKGTYKLHPAATAPRARSSSAIASTMMMCPQPSLDGRWASAVERAHLPDQGRSAAPVAAGRRRHPDLAGPVDPDLFRADCGPSRCWSQCS
jgi:heat shock protein HslJ